MNKKRKILTVVALAVFGAIIVFHYGGIWFWYDRPYITLSSYPLIKDVRMPLFVLAAFYAGLFFLLGPTATENRPPNP